MRLRALASFFFDWSCSRPQCRKLAACEPDTLWKVLFRGFTWLAFPRLLVVGSPEKSSQRVGWVSSFGANCTVFGTGNAVEGGEGEALARSDRPTIPEVRESSRP